MDEQELVLDDLRNSWNDAVDELTKSGVDSFYNELLDYVRSAESVNVKERYFFAALTIKFVSPEQFVNFMRPVVEFSEIDYRSEKDDGFFGALGITETVESAEAFYEPMLGFSEILDSPDATDCEYKNKWKQFVNTVEKQFWIKIYANIAQWVNNGEMDIFLRIRPFLAAKVIDENQFTQFVTEIKSYYRNEMYI